MMHRAFFITGIVVASFALGHFGWYSLKTAFFYFGPSEKLLSQTGYIEALDGSSAFRFEPKYRLWSDGADKIRYAYFPPGTKIDNSNPDRWNFPNGTRLWKEFVRDGVSVEIRMLFKYGDKPWDWDMSTYRWRKDKSDAYKVAFARSNVGDTQHDIPAPSQCVTCHSSGQNRQPLGLDAIQLPWTHDTDLSMNALIENDLLTRPPNSAYLIPGDVVTREALGYLDTNCGSCHYEGSTFVDEEVPLYLNLTTTTLVSEESTNTYRTAINREPYIPGLGADVYVLPGVPEKSFLLLRMGRRDSGGWQMPPLATEMVDSDGESSINVWIRSLAGPDDASIGRPAQ